VAVKYFINILIQSWADLIILFMANVISVFRQGMTSIGFYLIVVKLMQC